MMPFMLPGVPPKSAETNMPRSSLTVLSTQMRQPVLARRDAGAEIVDVRRDQAVLRADGLAVEPDARDPAAAFQEQSVTRLPATRRGCRCRAAMASS